MNSDHIKLTGDTAKGAARFIRKQNFFWEKLALIFCKNIDWYWGMHSSSSFCTLYEGFGMKHWFLNKKEETSRIIPIHIQWFSYRWTYHPHPNGFWVWWESSQLKKPLRRITLVWSPAGDQILLQKPYISENCSTSLSKTVHSGMLLIRRNFLDFFCF